MLTSTSDWTSDRARNHADYSNPLESPLRTLITFWCVSLHNDVAVHFNVIFVDEFLKVYDARVIGHRHPVRLAWGVSRMRSPVPVGQRHGSEFCHWCFCRCSRCICNVLRKFRSGGEPDEYGMGKESLRSPIRSSSKSVMTTAVFDVAVVNGIYVVPHVSMELVVQNERGKSTMSGVTLNFIRQQKLGRRWKPHAIHPTLFICRPWSNIIPSTLMETPFVHLHFLEYFKSIVPIFLASWTPKKYTPLRLTHLHADVHFLLLLFSLLQYFLFHFPPILLWGYHCAAYRDIKIGVST